MASNIVSFLSKALMPSTTRQVAPVKVASTNPFANPFVTSNANSSTNFYAKNKPVNGGYFAGYYNGKPNVVGQRLFIEV